MNNRNRAGGALPAGQTALIGVRGGSNSLRISSIQPWSSKPRTCHSGAVRTGEARRRGLPRLAGRQALAPFGQDHGSGGTRGCSFPPASTRGPGWHRDGARQPSRGRVLRGLAADPPRRRRRHSGRLCRVVRIRRRCLNGDHGGLCVVRRRPAPSVPHRPGPPRDGSDGRHHDDRGRPRRSRSLGAFQTLGHGENSDPVFQRVSSSLPDGSAAIPGRQGRTGATGLLHDLIFCPGDRVASPGQERRDGVARVTSDTLSVG